MCHQGFIINPNEIICYNIYIYTYHYLNFNLIEKKSHQSLYVSMYKQKCYHIHSHVHEHDIGLDKLVRDDKLATSTVLLVSTVLCVFRCWLVPIGKRHHGNHACLLFDCEVDIALVLPANQ